jgi:hypothetical protein
MRRRLLQPVGGAVQRWGSSEAVRVSDTPIPICIRPLPSFLCGAPWVGWPKAVEAQAQAPSVYSGSLLYVCGFHFFFFFFSVLLTIVLIIVLVQF